MSAGDGRMSLLPSEMLALSLPLLGAFIELTIRNGYHQIAAEPTHFVYLAAISFVSLLLVLFTESRGPLAPWSQVLRAGNRLLGLGAWTWIVGARGVAPGGWLAESSLTTRLTALAGIATLYWLVVGESRWRRMRPAVLIACTLFVVSQPVFGHWMSPRLAWPAVESTRHVGPAGTADVLRRSNGRAAEYNNVLILLLDELNARDGEALANVLLDRGMAVSRRAIRPVADTTAKVIPEIWSGRRFSNPKPCSFTAICSDGQALDFAKVSASRPDIDVVGFYHPYCAMQGLRWCERVGLSLPFYEAGRWACSVESRIRRSTSLRCMDLQAAPFLQLRQATLAALWRAPFWRQGGMLFAHLPLPHPPGEQPGGTLKQDYRDNLALASELLGRIVDSTRAAGMKRIRLVVFSDHPLRQLLWCGKPAYHTQGCQPEAELEDTQVPLIVGTLGGEAPDLGAIRSNGEVLDLAVLP